MRKNSPRRRLAGSTFRSVPLLRDPLHLATDDPRAQLPGRMINQRLQQVPLDRAVHVPGPVGRVVALFGDEGHDLRRDLGTAAPVPQPTESALDLLPRAIRADNGVPF
jgi:hypothetical protein